MKYSHPFRNRWRRVGMAALLVTACQPPAELSGPGQRICTTELRPALQVTVQDFVTKAFIASGATIVVQDGAFVDSLVVPAGRPDLDAGRFSPPRIAERPGTYTVRIRRPPYVELVIVGVDVWSDGCHVQTRTLNAQLMLAAPTPSA